MKLREILLYENGSKRNFYVVLSRGFYGCYENFQNGDRDHLVSFPILDLERMVLEELFGDGKSDEIWVINYDK